MYNKSLSLYLTFVIFILIVFLILKKNFLSNISDIFVSKKNIYNHIYLINLKRRPDRLGNFLKHYNNSDMKKYNIIKFEAIDGGNLDVSKCPLSELARGELQQLESTGFRTKHYQLTKGAIGCYLSHVKIWENILKHNSEISLIFEDDAQIPNNLNKRIHEEMENIPTDWDIVLFGFICKKCMKYDNYNEVERFMLTHCYMIKKESIVKIMNTRTLFPITQQIDSLMSELSSLINIYTAKEKLVPQFSSRTDIQAPLINKNHRKLLNINVNDRIKVL